MNEPDNHIAPPNSSRQFQSWLASLGILIVAAGAYSIYQGKQTQDLKRQFTVAQQDNAALRKQLADTTAELQSALDAMREDLAQSEQEASVSLEKAQNAAIHHADLAAAQLARKTAEEARQLTAELGQVKDAATDASNKIDGITTDVGTVKTDVGTVKTDVASTKSVLENTRSELQRARGDMGLMSGLIATNGKQIQQLRDLGDRNIYEFTLDKNGKMQKVGDIELMLRKADSGHNRFTVDVLADDKRVEKKDRTVNEPVQFYTSKARQPYELVVNKVTKNEVVGYLATPKVTVARNNSPAQ